MKKDLVIGIDVGGQTAKCGVVDAEGNILARRVIRSDEHTSAVEFLDALADALHALVTEAGAEGADKTAQEWLAESDEPSLLRKVDKITSKDIYEAACQGDELAIRVLTYTGTLLGQKLGDFIAFSAPEAIILFGGLARARKFLEEPIRTSMNENVVSLWRNKVNLLFSPLKESDAAILGAAALAWDVK